MADAPAFDHKGIDEVIHGPVRMAIMAFLSGARRATFGELKAHAGVTDGNLSVHLRKLEDAGYVTLEKAFVGRKPQTAAILTEAGREAWIAYLDRMGALLFGSSGGR